jgi:hypothetical protein
MSTKSLKEGEDYYLESGRMVFTKFFLESRGYCCKSGCRHCPYNQKLEIKVKSKKIKG